LYYYRLRIVRSDGNSIYSEIVSRMANVPTITPTITIGPSLTPQPSWTPFVWPTWTPSPTWIPTQAPTRIPSVTPTPLPDGQTRTPLVLNTLTETAIPFPTQSTLGPDETNQATQTPDEETPSASGTGTPVGWVDQNTPAPTRLGAVTPTPTPSGSGLQAWLSLLLGVLAGTSVVALAGWWWLRLNK
jgi:hypothetical protein